MQTKFTTVLVLLVVSIFVDQGSTQQALTKEGLEQIFKSYDIDSDGLISITKELRAKLQKDAVTFLNVDLDDDQLDLLLSKVDANKDGKLSFDEVHEAVLNRSLL